MIVELGHFALILACFVALIQATLPLWGAQRGSAPLMALARPAAQMQFLLVLAAFLVLVQAFIASDFSVRVVMQHSHSLKPLLYKMTGVWGNHEGSMLLWVLILTLFGALVATFGGNLPAALQARVLSIQAMIAFGFLVFTVATSNPFLRVVPPPADGQGLNPLLQDPGLAFHPPFLYLGYVGFSMAFSFAVAALIEGRVDAAWARWVRPWTLLAWCALTFGIAMGSWWAYYELGWGGWWFWDPVENASFMPWLIATALLHSAVVMEKRNALKVWTILLSILTFSLSLLGTFLVRSGVLTSVHAFATDPRRGVFILGFLVFVIGTSLALFAWRAPRVGLGGKFETVSRESFLLMNNVLLGVAAASVLLGTLYPLFLDALSGAKISVGPPYFNAVFVPIMAPLVFLMGIGPFARWKKAEVPDLALRLKWALGVSLATAIALPFIIGRWTPLVCFGLFLAFWLIASMVFGIRQRVRHVGGGLWERLRVQGRAYWGMQFAHLGVAVFIIGVTLVKGYEVERDVKDLFGGNFGFRINAQRFDRVRLDDAAQELTCSFPANLLGLEPQRARQEGQSGSAGAQHALDSRRVRRQVRIPCRRRKIELRLGDGTPVRPELRQFVAAEPTQIAVYADQLGPRIPPAQSIQNVNEL
jgi:cytochrome c-type biogenesis protein CcmF